ncbi:hypothetical protein ALC62_07214 [Cyphomyrmex costatus]|uniref:CCHC-type domain-containing protein n=1 Tax=Cyphomyrmex costatus TaxID=456900 RepID=A0A151II99_9HYME|nr:hypothetical protein ALC62_07214 [Cyphomyrmex costatus]
MATRTPPRDQTPEPLLISGEDNAQNSINPQNRGTPENRHGRRVTFQLDGDENDTQDSIETRVTNRQDEVLDRLVAAIAGLQDRMDRVEFTNRERENVRQPDNGQGSLNISYGRTSNDVRELTDRPTGYLRLKDARSIIPVIDGSQRDKTQEFISASTYAMEKINYPERSALLEEILTTKLKGKLLLEFQTRNVRDFEQLRREIENNYLGKRGTSYLQLEFNTLKQKSGENAHTYGQRVDQLAMEIYETLIEKRTYTSEQKRAILDTIQDQALLNFVLGLREDIKMIVRSQRYTNLQEAINAASAEERVKGPSSRTPFSDRNKDGSRQQEKIQCDKCGKLGHHGRECRSSRYATRFSLPQPEGRPRVNTVEKYCNYCKKAGHNRDECWTLNGRPDKNTRPRAKRETDSKTKNKLRRKSKKSKEEQQK